MKAAATFFVHSVAIAKRSMISIVRRPSILAIGVAASGTFTEPTVTLA